MKLKKALKILSQKGTGFIFRMNEMEQNYNFTKFCDSIQSYGYVLKYDSEDNKVARSFKFTSYGSGEDDYNYIDFLEQEFKPNDDKNKDDWGWYSFNELYNKFMQIPISFGIHDVVCKQPERVFGIY